jgi:hypothetical protein
METVTLSGGEYGGTTVETDDWTIGDIRDFSGWLYRRDNDLQAVHCGYA